MPRGPRVLLAASALLLAGASSQDIVPTEEFAADDECSAEDSSCALNALQRLHARSLAEEALESNSSVQDVDGQPFKEDCEDCMQNNAEGQTLGASRIWHYAMDCWIPCGRAGSCSYCGPGNACCRYMSRSDPPICQGVKWWPVLSFHTCVQPVQQEPARPTGPTLAPIGSASGYFPQVRALANPSDAPELTFYMYRAMGDNDYPPENVNTGNLAGVLWYLHNEVVVQTPRKFGITRIIRMKVKTKAPQPLLDAGMNFGVRYAFDSGRCTGPWDCNEQFARYGFFVGCNMVGDFPTDKWRHSNYYPNAIWYSLPGPCSSRKFNEHSAACVAVEPGGDCSGAPSGRGNCTFSWEPAGEITLDELEGIQDYKAFIHQRKHEFISRWDRGIGMSFWNGKSNVKYCQARIDAALKLFEQKYGKAEDLDTPKCDFNYNSFFHKR